MYCRRDSWGDGKDFFQSKSTGGNWVLSTRGEYEYELVWRNPLNIYLILIEQNLSELPKKLSYALRFPNELRIPSRQVRTWLTNTFHPLSLEPRYTERHDGGIPSYSGEGFLTIQNAIARAFVKLHSDREIPILFLQRLPIPSFKELQSKMHHFYIIAGFLYMFVSMVIAIVTEKEKQLAEAMKIMGLTQMLQWMAWFLKSMITLSISISLAVLLLSVSRF